MLGDVPMRKNQADILSWAGVTAMCVIVVLTFTGCKTMGSKEGLGTIVGAGAGGLLGNTIGKGRGRTAATVAGIFLGGMLGRDIGASLDDLDRSLITRTTVGSLESMPAGRTSTWRNPDSGNYGTVTPMRTYQTNRGYCREYQNTITVGGTQQSGYGTACRQPDGSWELIAN